MIKHIKRFTNENKYGKLNGEIYDKQKYREFKDISSAKTWGQEYYTDWSEKYKKTMRTSNSILNMGLSGNPIECYCGNTYREINPYLRFGKDDKFSHYRELSHILTLVLGSAPRIPENIVVYRLVGDTFIKKLIENNNKNSCIATQEKAFLSTSLLSDIVNSGEAYTNHKNMLKIYVEKGSVGIYVNTVTFRNEQEILLYPNGYLSMIEYPYFDKRLNKMIYECQLIYLNVL
ncbi:hypothetical protein Curi_c21940 [Gottschalkia acidurici 9a]|uniref:ADP ribosyltransferase domain-containing protein n=1 Tax=Gottschalkia acidurici (strain ATCC 7906 / DSM 604 / BCRC 14475 / CIP 104303 / KCTC 5404 / NCIMB 10678 / 9a) TaxID=1128398 RepID=K0B255_GOTA9|nr:ADP-ribosyltransferase [Gottschalkia acidurici]AFS79197.1 hypothetical protein Curi_c21940 [Gottschalkia acidurici 9a]